MVAAYLLRIQKKEVFGVLIASTPEEMIENGNNFFACHQDEARISMVKKFCEQLNIPLTVLRPRDEFNEQVMEPWIAARIQGNAPRLCQDCHDFRISLLHKQALLMNCGSIATGHFAKIFHHTDGTTTVHSSNDTDRDQSGQVARLPQTVLKDLELPLSELQLKEVVKIAENFQLHPLNHTVEVGQCLGSAQAWLEKRVPEDLRLKGEILDVAGGNRQGSHEGFHPIEMGKVWKPAQQQREAMYAVAIKAKDILVAGVDYWKDKAVYLTDCHWAEGEDLSTPMRGFLHRGGGANDLEVLVYPKCLGGAWVELIDGEDNFHTNGDLVVYKRRGKNAKTLVTGVMGKRGQQWPTSEILSSKENGRSLDKDFNF